MASEASTARSRNASNEDDAFKMIDFAVDGFISVTTVATHDLSSTSSKMDAALSGGASASNSTTLSSGITQSIGTTFLGCRCLIAAASSRSDN
jgi:hypothetical protein